MKKLFFKKKISCELESGTPFEVEDFIYRKL